MLNAIALEEYAKHIAVFDKTSKITMEKDEGQMPFRANPDITNLES